MPTFVVEAAHGSAWEYIPPATGHIGGDPIELGGTRVSGDAHGADALRLGVRCELAGPCVRGGEPWARFLALAVVLDDSRAPSAGVSAPAGHLRGTVGVTVAARDAGGGVYERTLSLDGHRLATARLCGVAPATLGSQRHVTRRVPCPLDASVATRVDTRAVADGPHTLIARVEDIAGTARTDTARITVDNLPPRAGTVALAGDPAEALSAHPSGFAGEGVTYDYRWERCGDGGCVEIGGTGSRTYRVRERDAGQRLRAVVAASDGGGTVRVASAQSGLVPMPATAPSRTVVGAAQPRGRLTAWLERGRRRLRRTTVTWPARVRIRGRLTDLAGRPLARTPVRMHERVSGRRWRPITGVRTRRDGRLTTFTRIGPSREVRLVYGSARVTLRLAVRAAVRVRIRHRGRLTVVSGRVRAATSRAPACACRSSRAVSAAGGPEPTSARTASGASPQPGASPAGARLRVVVPAQRGYPFVRGTARP